MGTKINLDYQVDDSQFDTKVNTNITTGASEASVVNTDVAGDTMDGTLTCPEISFGNAIAPGDTASIYGVQDGANTELNIRFGNNAADKLQIEYYNGAAPSVIVEMDGNLDVTYNVRDYLVNSTNDATFDLATDFLVDADGSITLDSPTITTIGALGHTGTATFSSNTTINGWLSIAGTTRAAGTFYAGTDSPISGNRLNYDGYLYTNRVYSNTIIVADELNMQSKNITSLLDPTSDQHAATKKYVDVAAASVEEAVVVEDTVALGEPVGILGEEFRNLTPVQMLSSLEEAYATNGIGVHRVGVGENNVFVVGGRGADNYGVMRCGQYIPATKTITWHNTADLFCGSNGVSEVYPIHIGNNYFMVCVYNVAADQDFHARVGHFTGSAWSWDTALSASLADNAQDLACVPFASHHDTTYDTAWGCVLATYANVSDHVTALIVVWNGQATPGVIHKKVIDSGWNSADYCMLYPISDIDAIIVYGNAGWYVSISLDGDNTGSPSEGMSQNTPEHGVFIRGEAQARAAVISDQQHMLFVSGSGSNYSSVKRATRGRGLYTISRNLIQSMPGYNNTTSFQAPIVCKTGEFEALAVGYLSGAPNTIKYKGTEFDPINKLLVEQQSGTGVTLVSDSKVRVPVIYALSEEFSLVSMNNSTDDILELQVIGTPKHIGFAKESITASQAGDVQISGVLSGLSGLVAGRKYYIDRANKSIKLNGGPKYAGRAISTTKLLIEK